MAVYELVFVSYYYSSSIRVISAYAYLLTVPSMRQAWQARME